MPNLWSKEPKRGPSMYVDLFDDISISLEIKFVKWEQQLLNTEWKHQFLNMYLDPVKDNSTSMRLADKGNQFYERAEWSKAIEMYNQALCFTEPNSPQISAIYAKRGFCFNNLKMFDEGIADMDLGVSLNLPAEWLPSIAEIKANCEQQLKLGARQMLNKSNEPKLSFQPDRTFPCIANNLMIKCLKDKTSFIVAREDIDVGKTVLVEDSFAIVANGYDAAYCYTCLKVLKNFIPCTNCVDVMFCNLDCMSRNNIHKITCGEDYHRMPCDIKFVIDSIVKAITLFPSIDDLVKFVETQLFHPNKTEANLYDSNVLNYALFLRQSTHNNLPLELTYKVYTTLMSMEFMQTQFNNKTKQRFLKHLVGHHTMMLQCNSYGGFEKDQNQFVSGTMGNVAAMFEHSCTPNMLHLTIDSRHIGIIIRPVKVGEHLTYDVCPEDEETENRKNMLLKCYGIDCECRKCNADSYIVNPMLANDPSLFFVANYLKYFSANSSALLKQKCVNFLRKYKDEPWSKEIEIVTKAYTRCLIAETTLNQIQ